MAIQPLALPSETYAKLLPHSFLAAHLPTTRPSHRSPLSPRPSTVNPGSLTHAHGSAVIRIGESAVVCGVRAEILKAADVDLPDDFSVRRSEESSDDDSAQRIAALGLLVPNVELSTGCHPSFLPGVAPGPMAQSLLQRVITLLRVGNVVRLEDLCIYDDEEDQDEVMGDDDDDHNEELQPRREVKAYFTLYLDILFLSLSGSAFDAAWLAILAALRDTKIPAARWDRDVEGVLCDPRLENYRRLDLCGCPVAISWNVFTEKKKRESVVLIDPDDFEESCCEEGGTLVVDFDKEEESILRFEKFGGGHFDIYDLKTVLNIARSRWTEWRDLLGKT